MPSSIRTANPATMAAPGGHYSHAVAGGGLVFVSGQLPIAPDGTKLNEAPFAAQARQVLDNVAQAVKWMSRSHEVPLAQLRWHRSCQNPSFHGLAGQSLFGPDGRRSPRITSPTIAW